MIKYSVKYEVEAIPSNVIIEIVCRDRLDAYDVYEQKRLDSYLKALEIIELDESQENNAKR